MGSLLPAIFLVSVACLAVFVDSVPGSRPEPPPFEDGEAVGMPLRREGKNPTARGDYRGGYGGHGGGGKGIPSECKDKKPGKYCQKVKASKKCQQAKKRNKCRKTCGDCVVEECKDTSDNCYQKNAFLCTQFWFSYGCQKTCGKCTDEVSTITTRQTTTTTTSTTTTTEEASKDCKDIAPNCGQASQFRCALAWFARGCKLTCGKCTTEVVTTTTTNTTPMPTAPPTTPQPFTEEMTTPEPTPTSPECMDHSQMCPFWQKGGLCDAEGEFRREMQDLCSATCEWCE